MPRSAYDILRLGQNRVVIKIPRYAATPSSGGGVVPPSGPASPPPPGVPAVGSNNKTFVVEMLGGAGRWSAPGDAGYLPTPITWPPTGTIYFGGGVPKGYIGGSALKTYVETNPADGTQLATYLVFISMMRFDTSSLPDDAQVATATLRLYHEAMNDNNRSLAVEWYPSFTGATAASDWTLDVDGSAHPGVPLSTLDQQGHTWVEIPLSGASANVSRTGMTAFRLGITGGQPVATNLRGSGWNRIWNEVHWRGKDYGYPGFPASSSEFSPRLVVSYD